MKPSRTTLPVVALALLLVGALLVWLAGDFGATRRNGADDARGESAVAPKEDAESSDLAAEILEQASTTRRAIDAQAVDVDAQGVPTVREEAPTSARDSHVVVRVTVAHNPWLESAWKGRLAWRDALGGDDTVDVVYGYLKLPREPRSSDQFSNLDFTGLAAEPLGLTRLDEVDDPDDLEIAAAFELATELVPGARLVWAPNVPSGERTAVRVVLGGPQPPSDSRLRFRNPNGGLVDDAIEVELPLALPRVTAPTSLWVGAPNRQWRSFAVAPEDTDIEVRLAPTAAIHVLHDGTRGEVVALAVDNGMETIASIKDTLPIEIGGLLSGEHFVWIRQRGDPWGPLDADANPLTRVARVTLVADVSTEVDLRPAKVLEGRGGVRVFVPATRAALPDHARSPVLVLWRDATATTKRTYCPAPRLVSESDEGCTYELLGLAPGRHTALVEAFAARASFDVAPGVVTDVAVELDCIGFVNFVEFLWPRGSQDRTPPPLTGGVPYDVVTDDGELLTWRRAGNKSPMVCGTYTVRSFMSWSDRDVGLTSTSFVVNHDSTTVVTVRAEPVHHVVVAAVDATTNAPIAFDAAFWLAIDARDTATDAEFVARTRPLGPQGAHTAVEWTLHPHADPVRFAVPEHPLWTFEPLEPRVLEDGATITLRATAR